MEKIFSFFKNNPVLIIALIVVILMMCKPRKKTKITEKFSDNKVSCGGHMADSCNKCPFSGTRYVGQSYCNGDCKWESNECVKKNEVKDLSKKVSCEGHDKNNCDTDRCEFKLNTCFSKKSCIIDNLNDESLENIVNSENSNNGYFYYDYDKDKDQYLPKFCENITTIDNQKYCNNNKNQKIISKDLTEELDKCVGIYGVECGINKNNYDIDCIRRANKKLDKFSKKLATYRYSNSQDKDINNDLENTMKKYKSYTTEKLSEKKDEFWGNRIKQAFKQILVLADKNRDKESLKDTSNPKKLLNYHVYINIITKAYHDGIKDKQYNQKEIKKIQQTTSNIYNQFKLDGLVEKIFGNFTEKFEKELFENLGFKFNVIIETYHRREGSYLITALTKGRLLSIGQVYQLRKLMLEAFKVETNRPFFSFYYDNFGPVADMLVKENRLSEILPNMLKCIDLSKNGKFDLAFEQYIVTARQAYQICKDIGMDTKDLEDKFEKLDGTIDMLPEPNSLFVENGFREALKSC